MRGRITSKNVGQAREGEERGKGIPLEDIERACRHHDISREEYLACPQCYPLPGRGTGLSSQ